MSVEILSKIEADLRVKLGKDENFVLADYFGFACSPLLDISGRHFFWTRRIFLCTGVIFSRLTARSLGALL